MVSNFSVAGLFKVNLLPLGGNAAQSVTKADLDKVKKLCQIEKVECDYENFHQLVERENAFTETYQSELAPHR